MIWLKRLLLGEEEERGPEEPLATALKTLGLIGTWLIGGGVDQDDAGDRAAFLEEDAGGLEGDDAAEGPACGWVECVNGGCNRGKKFLGVISALNRGIFTQRRHTAPMPLTLTELTR